MPTSQWYDSINELSPGLARWWPWRYPINIFTRGPCLINLPIVNCICASGQWGSSIPVFASTRDRACDPTDPNCRSRPQYFVEAK